MHIKKFGEEIPALLDSGGDISSQCFQLVGGHLDMMAKVEITRLVEGHQVDVDMWHIDTYHGFTNLDARTDFLQPLGNTLGEEMQFSEKIIV